MDFQKLTGSLLRVNSATVSEAEASGDNDGDRKVVVNGETAI